MLIQEDYFKNIFNTVHEGILILDDNMRVLSANRSFFNIFKVDPANTIGSLLYDLGNGQWNVPSLRVLLEDILSKNSTVDGYEIEHNFENIGQKTMLLNACKIREKKNDLPIILIAIEDITERTRLEDLLTESEERYRRIFETSSDGIVLLEKREGHITHTNPAAEKMLDCSKEECIGKKLSEVGVSLDMSDFPTIMQLLDKSGIIKYDDVQVKTKAGQYIHADIYMVDKARLVQCNIRDISERKQADATLKDEKILVENALNALEDVFFVFDLEGKFIRWNKAMNAVSGYSDREIALMKPADFFRNDDIERVSEAILEAIKEGSASANATVVTKDGRQIPYEYRAVLLRDNTGNLIGISGVGRDLTGRKKAEAELKLFRKLLDQVNDSILVVDPETGRLMDVNEKACEALGYGRKELLTMAALDISSPVLPDQTSWKAHVAEVRNKGHMVLEEWQHRKDGTTFPVEININYISLEESDYMVAIIRDITERRNTEKALKESEARFRSAFENAAIGFSIYSTDGHFLRVNRALCDMLAYSEEELMTRTVTDITHPDDLGLNIDHLNQLLSGKLQAVHFQERYIHKLGHEVWVSLSTSVARDDKEVPIYLISLIEDLTEKKKLEAQLRHAQKMEAVGTLAGGIAHDFNNILNVIIGYGSMVLDKLDPDSPSKSQMNEMLTAAEKAANLTKRLLVFSRKQIVEVKLVNINDLILSLQKMLVRIIGEDINFQLDLADRPLMVLADAGQIEQVLMNLVSNARDAMPKGGRLTIGTGLQEINDEYIALNGYGILGMYALITVADTGKGMDRETRENIFEPFFSTKGIGEGTGLGLAISYGIIKQHNGYIKVYSEPGQGTVFNIYLPLVEESALPDKKTETAFPVEGGNETVLVAEDDASLRELTRIVLESNGYSVITAEDGEDAITKFMENRERIDLVMLDMVMPKKSGKEVSEALRRKSPRIKILFESGYTMDIIREKELTESGFDFIHKPNRPQDLLRKVRELLDK